MAVHEVLEITLTLRQRRRRLCLLEPSLIAAIGFLALAVPLSPANAEGFIGFNIGPFGFGIGDYHPYYVYTSVPYYAPGYYYYAPGYYYPPVSYGY
jgi:hypothetical protein